MGAGRLCAIVSVWGAVRGGNKHAASAIRASYLLDDPFDWRPTSVCAVITKHVNIAPRSLGGRFTGYGAVRHAARRPPMGRAQPLGEPPVGSTVAAASAAAASPRRQRQC